MINIKKRYIILYHRNAFIIYETFNGIFAITFIISEGRVVRSDATNYS